MGSVDVNLQTFHCGKLLLTVGTGVHLSATGAVTAPHIHSPHVGGEEMLLHQHNAGERLRAQRALEGRFTALVGLAVVGKGCGAGKFFGAVATFIPARKKNDRSEFENFSLFRNFLFSPVALRYKRVLCALSFCCQNMYI